LHALERECVKVGVGGRDGLAGRLPTQERTGDGLGAERQLPRAGPSRDATDDFPAVPVEGDLLPGLDLFRNLHMVGSPVGVLEAEKGAHTTFIGVTGRALEGRLGSAHKVGLRPSSGPGAPLTLD
jgi:hypothetical protein